MFSKVNSAPAKVVNRFQFDDFQARDSYTRKKVFFIISFDVVSEMIDKPLALKAH